MENKTARLTTTTGSEVQFLGATMQADLRGLLFEACVEQRFINRGQCNVEATYTFPLPWGAVLLGVEVDLGDKRLSGCVVEKRLAQVRYEESLSDGDAAIMLERNLDESITLNLGNLNAGEACTVRMQYAQSLQFDQRALRLLIPTVIAPRYGDPVREGGLDHHQVSTHSLVAEHPFELTLRLHGPLAQCRVASPSHAISLQTSQEGDVPSVTVGLARSDHLDRDFVLILDQLQHGSLAVMAKDLVNPERTAVLASFCPQIKAAERQPTAIKMLVDCSGSMAGDSMDAAKRALQAIVRQLQSGDRFSLSRFGSGVEHRARGLWKVTETTRLAAQRWVGSLEADLGGTEMAAALMSTFEIAQTAPSDVLLVTDGEISGIDQTIAVAGQSGHRIFVVGIGSSPAESHLRRLAAATGGACDFVAPGEAVEPAVLRMFARLRSPQVTDLRLRWSSDVEPEWTTPLSSAVFDEDTLNIHAFVKGQPRGSLALLGRRTGDVEPVELARVELPAVLDDAPALSRMTAAAQIHSSSRIEDANSALQPSVDRTGLAVAYQLLTGDTNFLLVHHRAEHERAVEMPDLHRIAPMMPAGWGGTSTVNACVAQRSGVDVDLHEYRASYSISDPAHGLGVPSVWRRRDPDGPQTSTLYKSTAPHHHGLTPLGLSDRLLIDQPWMWPDSYAELEEYLLDPIVVDWLRLVIGAELPTSVTEQEIVCAFLYFMAQQSTYDGLLRGTGLLGGIREKLKAVLRTTTPRLKKAQEHEGPVNPDALAAVKAGLVGMTATEWPDRVLALEV